VDSTRRTALIAGALFLITFVSIPALLLYDPILNHAGYIVGAGADTRIALGALLEFITLVANIGTAVVLFPILKRQNEAVSLGYVGSRVVESTLIAVGIVSLLAVVALRQDINPAGQAISIGKSLVAVHDATFLLGPGLLAGLGNGILLGYLLYRSRLVPRGLAMLGLIGGPLVMASGIAVLFGVYDQTSSASLLLTIPEAVYEFSLGVYLVVRGFKPSPITSQVDVGASAPVRPLDVAA
jgi:Domain of unknown function (DUF4386)